MPPVVWRSGPLPKTTPPPPPAPAAPTPLTPQESMRLRVAECRVRVMYPGPVGELLAREIMTWCEFGYRLDSRGLMARVIDHVMQCPSTEGSP